MFQSAKVLALFSETLSMGSFELNPLSDETVQELGLTPHELWSVMIGEETFGPFDTQSLKQYSWDNEEILDGAYAAKLDEEEWTPFFDCMEFPKKSLSVPAPEPVLVEEVVEEKVEVVAAESHPHTAADLPQVPQEIFYQIKSNSTKKLPTLPDELAVVLAHDHTDHNPSALKIDEITLSTLKQSESSFNFMWAAPIAVAVLIGVFTGGYYILKPNVSGIADISQLPEEKVLNQNGMRVTPTRREPAYREPSSVRPFQHNDRSSLTQPNHNNYPTRTEGHDYNNDVDRSEQNDPAPDEVAMSEPQIEQEPQSLEGAMGGSPTEVPPSPEVPVLESSDF